MVQILAKSGVQAMGTFLRGVGTGAALATVRTHARTRAAVPRGSNAYMAATASPATAAVITSVLCGWGGGIFQPGSALPS